MGPATENFWWFIHLLRTVSREKWCPPSHPSECTGKMNVIDSSLNWIFFIESSTMTLSFSPCKNCLVDWGQRSVLDQTCPPTENGLVAEICSSCGIPCSGWKPARKYVVNCPLFVLVIFQQRYYFSSNWIFFDTQDENLYQLKCQPECSSVPDRAQLHGFPSFSFLVSSNGQHFKRAGISLPRPELQADEWGQGSTWVELQQGRPAVAACGRCLPESQGPICAQLQQLTAEKSEGNRFLFEILKHSVSAVHLISWTNKNTLTESTHAAKIWNKFRTGILLANKSFLQDKTKHEHLR